MIVYKISIRPGRRKSIVQRFEMSREVELHIFGFEKYRFHGYSDDLEAIDPTVGEDCDHVRVLLESNG